MVLLPVRTSAQHYILKVNGEKIEFKKLKRKSGSVWLTTTKKEKISIPLQEISKQIDEARGVVYYLKPSFDLSGEISGLQFIERIIEGKVRVYERISYINNREIRSLYLEKDDTFINVFASSTIGQNKQKKLARFKSLVKNDPVSFQKLNDESYKHSYDNIIEVVKGYNLRMYKENEAENEKLGKLVFFRGEEKQSSEIIQLSIESLKYEVKVNGSLEVELPINSESKVCITNSKNDACLLVLGSEHIGKYYEIALSNETEGFFDSRDKKYSEYFLRTLEVYANRRKRKD